MEGMAFRPSTSFVKPVGFSRGLSPRQMGLKRHVQQANGLGHGFSRAAKASILAGFGPCGSAFRALLNL